MSLYTATGANAVAEMGNVYEVTNALGHSSMTTALTYLSTSRQQRERVASAFHPGGVSLPPTAAAAAAPASPPRTHSTLTPLSELSPRTVYNVSIYGGNFNGFLQHGLQTGLENLNPNIPCQSIDLNFQSTQSQVSLTDSTYGPSQMPLSQDTVSDSGQPMDQFEFSDEDSDGSQTTVRNSQYIRRM